MKLMFIGDVVGSMGRDLIDQYVPLLKKKYKERKKIISSSFFLLWEKGGKCLMVNELDSLIEKLDEKEKDGLKELYLEKISY